jgi:hypothetical protein
LGRNNFGFQAIKPRQAIWQTGRAATNTSYMVFWATIADIGNLFLLEDLYAGLARLSRFDKLRGFMGINQKI